MIRTCTDCQSPFSIEPEEEDWFRREGLRLPKRCPRCRAARRGVVDEYLRCSRCGRTFVYPREIQLYARSYGWKPPRRCIGGCPGRDLGEESTEERAMRELMERLRDRRGRAAAPPIEAVLEAERFRGSRPAPPPSPAPDALFRGLEDDADRSREEDGLREGIQRFQEQRKGPEDLFSSLAEEDGSRPRAKKKKHKRRPRRSD